MPKNVIVALKLLLHLALLAPLAWLLRIFHNGTLALNADPVNYITHFTGDWALWILLGSLAITPVRRLSTHLSFLIRFRRLIGLYAFFYATLHLATYIFLFSGYDLAGALRATAGGHPGELLTQWHLVWPTIRDDLRKRRFIQVGLFSWLILLALTVTSPTAVLRAMGGKAWGRLHRLVYLAGFTAIVHFWWLVKVGNRAPLRVTAILFLLFAARLAFVVYRKLRPPARPGVS